MSLDTSLIPAIRTHILCFLIGAFQSLDNGLIRKECAALVSISIWHNLASEAIREAEFDKHIQLKKAWRASIKRYDGADPEIQSRLRFERSWLYTMSIDFIGRFGRKTQGIIPSGPFHGILTTYRRGYLLRTISRIPH